MTLHVRQRGQTPRLSVGYQQLSAREIVTSFCKLRMGGGQVWIQERLILALILISAKDKQAALPSSVPVCKRQHQRQSEAIIVDSAIESQLRGAQARKEQASDSRV